MHRTPTRTITTNDLRQVDPMAAHVRHRQDDGGWRVDIYDRPWSSTKLEALRAAMGLPSTATEGDIVGVAARLAGVPPRELFDLDPRPEGLVIDTGGGGVPLINVPVSRPDGAGRVGLMALHWDRDPALKPPKLEVYTPHDATAEASA